MDVPDIQTSTDLGPSPQSSPRTSPVPIRRKLGQSQSFPSAAMREYVARMQKCSDVESKLEEELIEEVDEEENEYLQEVNSS